ncbi:MAG: methionine gamma-lyase family protein [Clostridia bacterium]|nr:methionine gamma-lyase family protein [Clostridia bacterium]
MHQIIDVAGIFDARLNELAQKAIAQVRPLFDAIDATSMCNQQRVLEAFREHRVSNFHFNYATGYGYDDEGRDVVERVFATTFGSDKAIVRPQIVSGTHAISIALFGILRPGDVFVSITGEPYQTLNGIIGASKPTPGCLAEWGVEYLELPLKAFGLENGTVDIEGIRKRFQRPIKLAYIQRSRGYLLKRKSLSAEEVGRMVRIVKEVSPDTLCLVDNCYGEFVSTKEPTHFGADLAVGSLIKNPGGGLAITGGYICGRSELISLIASRLMGPGLGLNIGPSLGTNRFSLQGLFVAPHVVAQALKGAIFAAKLAEMLGFEVFPKAEDQRGDIVQTIVFGKREQMLAFCRGVQRGSPVNSHVKPEPAQLPGYQDPIIMAAGTFVEGSSIELSADGVVSPPYAVFLQGGLTFEHIVLGVLYGFQEMLDENLLSLQGT